MPNFKTPYPGGRKSRNDDFEEKRKDWYGEGVEGGGQQRRSNRDRDGEKKMN